MKYTGAKTVVASWATVTPWGGNWLVRKFTPIATMMAIRTAHWRRRSETRDWLEEFIQGEERSMGDRPHSLATIAISFVSYCIANGVFGIIVN